MPLGFARLPNLAISSELLPCFALDLAIQASNWGGFTSLRQTARLYPNDTRKKARAKREKPRKGSEYRDVFCVQGRHWPPLGRVFALAYPAFR